MVKNIKHEEISNKENVKMWDRFTLPHNVFEEEKFINLNVHSKFLYVIFAKLANRMSCDKGANNGWFFCSLKNLKLLSNLSESTLKRCIKKLEYTQYLEVQRGYNPHNGYRSANFYRINGFRYQIAKGVFELNPKDHPEPVQSV